MDKETIIKGCENWVNNHKGENFLLTYSSVVELLALLKEQEAVTIKRTKENVFGVYGGTCPKCHNWIQAVHSFCGFCGQEVKWE